MLRDDARPALLSFFLPLTRRTCAELGVGDDTIAAYLAEVLAEFARTDRLYRLRAPGGARLERVVEMLGLGPPTLGQAGARAFHRYVGDFALFMSGLFRSFVERGGCLGYYLERSGFPPERLVNIHGTDSAVECMACHRRAPRAVAQAAWEAGTAVPRCDCGGPWKPATISFGQQLVAADLERALGAAAACDLFVAAGTSLVVGPVNQMFPVAREAGARTAIVTASETPYDAAADVRLAQPVERVLPAVWDLLG